MKIPIRLMTPLFISLMTLLIVLFLRLPAEQKSSVSFEKKIIQESMQGVHAKRFDLHGRLIQIVTMKSWLRYQGETVSHMISPALQIYHQDGTLWDISSARGEGFQTRMDGKLEKLHLSDNVIVKQSGYPNQFWWELTTQNLDFFTKRPMASTDDPVFIKGPGLQIQATGIRAFLEQHYVQFVKNVTTVYEKSA